jgi:hypothetical protein
MSLTQLSLGFSQGRKIHHDWRLKTVAASRQVKGSD